MKPPSEKRSRHREGTVDREEQGEWLFLSCWITHECTSRSTQTIYNPSSFARATLHGHVRVKASTPHKDLRPTQLVARIQSFQAQSESGELSIGPLHTRGTCAGGEWAGIYEGNPGY